MTRRAASEEGAVLIHVILAIVALIAFNIFVIDYGVMWAGRGQAQNAADAGALAGAVSLAFDDFDDRTETGAAKTAARALALSNGIWGEAPDVDIAADITFPTVPDVCADESCIRVDVYRNQERGNALPAIFGSAAGLTEQGVRAMAIARAAIANASDCLKPWGIPDKWNDVYDTHAPIDANTWTPDDRYELEYENGPNRGQPLPNPDVYTPPGEGTTGTGFNVTDDYGRRIVLKSGNPNQAIRPGWFFPIDLPQADGSPSTGGDNYRENISGCNGVPIEIGDTLITEPGNMIGPTAQGVEEIIAQDPNAAWDPVTSRVVNSCAQAATPCASRSPRIVAIPIFDTHAYEVGRQAGRTEIVIVNILGFFIDELNGNDVAGYLVSAPGLQVGDAPFDFDSAFLKTVVLVR